MTMSTTININDIPDFDAAEYLETEEDIAAYLTAIMEENNPGLLAAALGDIARARGMSSIAKDSGVQREALYKALRPTAQPRYETIVRVFNALGVKLTAQPIHPKEAAQP